MVSSKKSISLRRRSRRTGGGGAPPFKNIMKHYERLVDYIDVDNVKTRTSMWEYLHSCMTKHLRVDDSMRQRSDEGTEDYVRNITSVMDKTISEAVAADALDTAEPAPTRMEIIEHLDDVFGIPCFDEPPTLFSRVDKPPTLPSSEEAESVLPSHEMEKVDCSANKNNVIEDCSSSFDIAPEETTDHSEDCESDRERVKTIRFADEDGLPMETVYMLGGPDDPAAVGRVVVLLLKPEVRKFEFIYAEYRLNSKTSVSNLLEQLPGMASHEILTAQTYSSLFRSREGCSELIGALPLQDCRLDKNEVIIGVMSGYSGQGIMKCALPLIYNDKLSKVVSSFRLMQPIHKCDSYKLTSCVLSLSIGETGQTNRPWSKAHPVRRGTRGRERK
jgi:hypothetical protein